MSWIRAGPTLKAHAWYIVLSMRLMNVDGKETTQIAAPQVQERKVLLKKFAVFNTRWAFLCGRINKWILKGTAVTPTIE